MYANIERELLVVVYGCEKFHTYLFGHRFTVHSDHKPPRDYPLMRLSTYDLVIQPGKSMEIVDALSRLSPEEKNLFQE